MDFVITADLQVDLESVQKQFLVAFLKFLLNFILYLNQTFPEVRFRTHSGHPPSVKRRKVITKLIILNSDRHAKCEAV